MGKNNKILISVLVLTLFLFPLIKAQSYFDFEYAQEKITKAIDLGLGILSPVLEKVIGDYSTSDFFFHKILLFILLTIIIKNVLDRTPIGDSNKKVGLMLSVIISILSIRFISENDFFEAIFIQYGVLGIAITTILPMVIFFYFIHNTKVGTYGRKIFWTLYGVTLTAIWLLKSSEIPEVANWIYGLTLIIAIIFIFFDSTIHSYFGLSNFHVFMKKSNREGILRAKERLLKAGERLGNGLINQYEYNQIVREEEKLIKELSKE